MKDQIIHTYFEENALLHPERIAVEEGPVHISYGDLNRKANSLAHLLISLGHPQGSIIGLLLPPGIPLIQSMLAVFKGGNIYLPMDISFPKKRFKEILEKTPCRTIITNRSNQLKLQSVLSELAIVLDHFIILDEDRLEKPEDAPNPAIHIEPDAGLYIVYTSGSTGEGKGILGCQKGLHHFIKWEIKEFELDATCRVSQLSQVTFDSSFRDILVPLTTGGTLCIPSPETKENVLKLIEWIDRSGITLIHCVPSLFRTIIKELRQNKKKAPLFSSLKYILMAGESLFSKDIRNWTETAGDHTEIVNLYGTSETTLAKTFHRIRELPPDPSQAIHVGKPIDNTFVAIIHDGELCRIGEIGEIYIQTPYRTRGYYNNPEWNKAAFVQNPLIHDRVDIVHKTGDFGRYLKDRNIEYLGRMDDQVKVNGIRVELNEIKMSAMRISGIGEVEIIAQKNNDNEVELICYYTGDGLEDTDIRDFLKDHLNENILPSYFVWLSEFPLNINGKVDRKKLPAPELQSISSADYSPPLNETERTLEKIWMDVLGLQQIGRAVSFFRIGGNSLRAMQVISRIFHKYSVSVTISDIFLHPTIAGLAAIIAGSAGREDEEIIPIAENEYYDVSHGQKRIWVLMQLEQDLSAYNISGAFFLSGALDTGALQKAFDTIQQRHESLRTTFHYVEGEVRQKIKKPTDSGIKLEVTDLRALPDRYARARDLGDKDAAASFDLEAGPLFTARLLRMETDKYLILLNMHHIISDDWSLKVLIHEVFVLYEVFCSGSNNPLPPLRIQYKDFAAWFNRRLNEGLLESEKKYWVHRFSENIPLLKLDADFRRPEHKSYAGSLIRSQIDKELSRAMGDFCRQNDVTLFMLLLAAVEILLYKYTGDTDIVIGSPVAGRVKKELEDQIGLYINVLPLRTGLDASEDFITFLNKIKLTTLEAFDHQLYPFDRLVEDLQLDRDRSRSPLFDVMVVLQDSATRRTFFNAMGDILITDYETDIKGSKYDLEFNFYEEEDGIALFIHYNSDLYLPARIQLLRERFVLLLKIMLEQPRSGLWKIADAAELSLKTEGSPSLSWNITL